MTPFRFNLQNNEQSFGDIIHETDTNFDRFRFCDSDDKNIKPSIKYKQSMFSSCSSTSDEIENFESEPIDSPVNKINSTAGQKLFFCVCENWSECSRLCGML